ncbi:hypothetical protein DPMN_083366 [Dreissena polymorpha]|uniref:Uncharacterized protein n=2 Tax=Dreissena polymorpha TaxID=45954 RepID=A0A9D3Y8M2_DREPO|nr:hypothetical protein DPMN_083366 [Dreissena polymorpha]
MKQMQDNHLFGDDTSQMSLTPDIREVSLRNISQAVDLEEFRKQNQLENLCHLDDIVIPRRQAKTDETEFKCSFTNLNDGFNWSFPNSDSHEINARPSSSDTLYDTNKKRCNGMESALNDSDEFGPFITGTLDTNSFNCPVFEVGSYPSPVVHSDKRYSRSEEHVYEVPAGSLSDCNHKPKITSNGDAFSNIIKPKTKMLSFAQEPFLTTDNSSEASSVATCDVVQQRRLSIPETKQKDSRTFHPRKRQTIHGNRRGRSQTAFKVDKFSKEELLLMWKPSELELNDKLHADVKDKQRHDTKLNSPKIQMSTEV